MKLTSINIPDGVTKINDWSFGYCFELTSINIPDGVTSIGDGAFARDESLTSLTIPESVTYIGVQAIEATGLTSLTIPESVTSFGHHAFQQNSKLTSITLPKGLTTISNGAFDECRSLTSITIPEGVTLIDTQAFRFCDALTSVTIPESVTSIGGGAFENCTSLKSIFIPKGVTRIGDSYSGNGFSYCWSLESIVVEEGNTVYTSSNGANAIIEIASNKLLLGCMNTLIPVGVTTIGNNAFRGCYGLTSITIPEGVTYIDDYAFAVTGLTSITIPEGVTYIGNYAFAYCENLTSVTIPASTEHIRNYAFEYCSNLQDMLVGMKSPSSTGITYQTFEDCNQANVTLYVPKGSGNQYRSAAYWNQFGEIVESDHIPSRDDCITVDNVTSCPGISVECSIGLTNKTTDLTSYRFYLTLPTGISLAKDADGKFMVTTTNRYEDESPRLTIIQQADGSYRVSCNSPSNGVITGNEGPILNMTLTANANVRPGSYKASVYDATAIKTDQSQVWMRGATFNIEVIRAKPVTVTAKSYSISYGSALPDFEFTSVGATLEGVPTLSCAATATSPVGTYPIVVTKGSVQNINITYVDGTLTITKTPLVIKAGNYTKAVGEDIPTFTATYEGFVNDETADVLKKQPTLACEATVTSAPGEYPITVSGAEATNYKIYYVSGKLTVTPGPVVVTAKSYSRVYGTENPVFEYDVEGATLEGTPKITCEATATSPVGEYPIIISKGSVSNTNDTYVAGVLTITKAPLTIKAGSYTMKQGQALPTFTATYEGFKNDETSEVLTKQPVLTCEATAASAPGEYDVTVSGAEAENYEISYVTGTLTVTAADPVTVTAKSYTIKYGEALPDFEYTSEGATLEGVPTLSCEATVTSSVGEYPIVISKGSVTNYNDTYVAGVLTIEKAPLTIKAGSYTMKQGQALPTFAATYEGFKNDETADVLTTKPTLTTAATSASEPGEYEVTVSGAEAQNYEISYVVGTLKVELLKGDVTGDGFVTDDDVTALVNYILGLGTLVNEAAAYVNDDEKIDIADVTALIGIVTEP